MYTNTITKHVEAPSLEMSNLCLYFSDSCIPINPKLSPRIFSCFQFDFSVKSIKFSTRNSKYFVYILQQLQSMRRTHVGNPTWINSISPELCPPLTCERACSGNEIANPRVLPALYIFWKKLGTTGRGNLDLRVYGKNLLIFLKAIDARFL
jgi:hypothetical protein